MPDPEPLEPRTPRGPRAGWIIAGVIFVLAALTVCWPMLGGRFLLGDDQYLSGYAFRLFGAEMFRQTGSIPHWDPYIFGGLPFVAAMHGDIFYPTAWLRWILPIDTAMNLSFAVHFVLAGWFMYAFLRALRLGWTGAVVGGVAYELSGILASLVHPGHDGKLYVSALAPLLLLALLIAIRDRRIWGYGLISLTVGLSLLTPQTQMTYYLLVAGGIWTLYLVFFDPDRPAGIKWPVVLACALGAVLLGVAIDAIQAIPFLTYLKYTARGAGGASTGWAYATGFAMPVEELFTTVLPQFNGVLDNYWGSNFFKSHTEYLGAVVVMLALIGAWRGERRSLKRGLGIIAVLFLLVAFGGHTPFYRLWYEVMPLMKKVRAAGMAFYLPALVVTVYAGMGADRLMRREVSLKPLWIGAGVLGVFALLGSVGALNGLTTALAEPQTIGRAMANFPALQAGAVRLLFVVLVATAVLWSIGAGRLTGWLATAALVVITVGDLWSIDHLFFDYKPPAAQVYADDPITSYLKTVPKPYRVLEPSGGFGGFAVYGASVLMGYDIPQVLGYHGQELRFYDDLLGGKNVWQNQLNPNVIDAVAAGYLLINQDQTIPGYHKVVGPVQVSGLGQAPGVLYARDSMPPYARVISAAIKVPEEQIVPTVISQQFQVDRLILLPDTTSITLPELGKELPPPATAHARVTEWAPGRMQITLDGSDARSTFLLVSENWDPDWHATVDGKPAPVLRGDNTFITVPLPPAAREVELRFDSATYRRGRLVTFIALLITAVLLSAYFWRRPTSSEAS